MELIAENVSRIKGILHKYNETKALNTLEQWKQIKKILEDHKDDISNYHYLMAPEWNVFRLMGMERYEVAFHTPFLYELLIPYGSHGQGSLFLNTFLLMVAGFSEDEIGHPNWHVRREHEYIDLRIVNGVLRKAVFIENKIDTKAHSGQLSHYFDLWKNNYPEGGAFIYLTIDGMKPPEEGFDPNCSDTRGELENSLLLRSYRMDIHNWLESILERIKSEKVKQSIIQYINTIENL